MSARQQISSNTPWETLAGFSRALRVGNMLFVSGTTASDEHGNTVHANDAGEQARYILEKIERTLNAAGAALRDVARTRIYVVRYEDWEVVARVHGEFFHDTRPANTLVVVRSLVPADALVEIEADAVVQ